MSLRWTILLLSVSCALLVLVYLLTDDLPQAATIVDPNGVVR